MQSKQIDRLSRIIITILVFIVLNIWFLYENDPQWFFSIILSGIVFLISFPSTKLCNFLIKKGEKIKNKILNVLFYIIALPLVFFIFFLIVALFLALLVTWAEQSDLINLGWALLIAYTGIGIFICILVPYFQTLIILILKTFSKNN